MGLQVWVEAGGGVLFIAAQFAFDAQGVAAEILVATAVVATTVVVGPGGQGQGAEGDIDRLDPAQGGAVELAVEVDHAAAAVSVGHDGFGIDKY